MPHEPKVHEGKCHHVEKAERERCERERGREARNVAQLQATCVKLGRHLFNSEKLQEAKASLALAQDRLAKAESEVETLQNAVRVSLSVTQEQIDAARAKEHELSVRRGD